MRRAVGHFQEERSSRPRRFLDECHRPFCDHIGHVAVGAGRLVVLELTRESLGVRVAVVVDETALESEETIETVCHRAEGGSVAEVPFPDEGRGVAVALEQGRQ